MTAAKTKEGGRKALYRLNKKYWDGEQAYYPGDTYWFVPGTQPKTAKQINEPELAPEVGTTAGADKAGK